MKYSPIETVLTKRFAIFSSRLRTESPRAEPVQNKVQHFILSPIPAGCHSSGAVPALREIQHHLLCCSISFSIGFVGERPVQFFFVSRTEESPMSHGKLLGVPRDFVMNFCRMCSRCSLRSNQCCCTLT